MTRIVQAHFYTLTAFVLTLLTLYALLTRQEWDSQWMLKWNGIDGARAQLVYGVLAVVCLLAVPFEQRIRSALRRIWPLVLLALVVSIVVVRWLEPDQEHRLFITPFSVWVMVAHGVGLSALLVMMVYSDAPRRKYAFIPVVTLGVVLFVLHAVSITEFMYLDLPDEPFNASIATNYAENNDLSSSYIGSAYGSPDVVFPRYYLAMGVWLKLVGNTSLWAMRAFALLVGGATLALFALTLWRLRHLVPLSPTQIVVACVVFMGVSTFVRTAHNLRMDIMLALYGVLMLWGMLGFWSGAGSKQPNLLLMGLALFLGMEGVPTVALPMSAAVGVMLVLWWLRQTMKRPLLRHVVVYAAVCLLAVAAYYLLQLLPDVSASLTRYRGFVQGYANATAIGTLRLPLDSLAGLARFSLILSPVELIGGLLAFGLLWWRGQSAERWMLAALAFGFVISAVFLRLAYSYLVVFAPFVAYAVARNLTFSLRSRRMDGLIAFIFVPALLAAPIFDLASAVQVRRNETRLQAIDTLTNLFPRGTTIVGDDVFWFTLHAGRTFLGVNGLVNYTAIRHVEYAEALKTLDVDALLCDQNDNRCPAIVATGWFGEPSTYTLGDVTYNLYWKTPSTQANKSDITSP